MKSISFQVLGTPQPKGSASAFMHQDKAGRMHSLITSANPQLKAWQLQVAWQASIQARDHGLFTGPVAVSLHFYLPRPRSLTKKMIWHTRKPDLDKLIRAVNDGLTGVLYQDDAQVMSILASKDYAIGGAACYVMITVADFHHLVATATHFKDGQHGRSTAAGQQSRSCQHHGRPSSQTLPPDPTHGKQSGQVGQEDHGCQDQTIHAEGPA